MIFAFEDRERMRCGGCGTIPNDQHEYRAYTRVCPNCEKAEGAYDAATRNAREANVDLFGLKVDLKPIHDGKPIKLGTELGGAHS